MDIADLSAEKFPPKFTIESEQLGQLGFRKVYGVDYPYLMSGTSTKSDEEFVGKLMVCMGWRMEGLKPLSEADRSALSRHDMEAFSQGFIEHEATIFENAVRNRDEDMMA